jgi:hypothetical protein
MSLSNRWQKLSAFRLFRAFELSRFRDGLKLFISAPDAVCLVIAAKRTGRVVARFEPAPETRFPDSKLYRARHPIASTRAEIG